ncbi:MAG: hypothetical protein ACTSYS_04760 [Promethearchaeota archaeon]
MSFSQTLYTTANFATYFGSIQKDNYNALLCRIARVRSTWGVIEPNTYQLIGEQYVNIPYYDLSVNHYREVASQTWDGFLRLNIFATSVGWRNLIDDINTTNGNFEYNGNTYIALMDLTVTDQVEGLVEQNQGTLISSLNQAILDSIMVNDGKEGASRPQDKKASFSTDGYGVEGEYLYSVEGIADEQVGAYLLKDPLNTNIPAVISNTEINVTTWGGDLNPTTSKYDLSCIQYKPSYTIRPESTLYQSTHYWRSEDRVIAYDFWGSPTWIHADNSKQKASKVLTSGWSVKNVFVKQTFTLELLVGAYYDWHPYQDDRVGQDDVDPYTTDNRFSVIPSGTLLGSLYTEIPSFFAFLRDFFAMVFGNPITGLITIIVTIVVLIGVGYAVYKVYKRFRNPMRKMMKQQEQLMELKMQQEMMRMSE